MTWELIQGDCLEILAGLPADSADLVFGSPPYEQARLYLENGDDLGIARDTEAWVAWMVQVFRASLRVCKGLVAFVVEGQTKGYRWSAGPALLMADLHRAGIHLRKPPVYKRVGIPGSGGPDWLRNDYEFIVCATRGGRLPWSDNTACGHPPKWAPGGEMSHRLTDGTRCNQWGGHPRSSQQRRRDGSRQPPARPSHVLQTVAEAGRAAGEPLPVKNGATRGYQNGDTSNDGRYKPPALANPGNVIAVNVGGGQMGNELCHQNEAPFPEALAEFFVRSFCPVGGKVLDPFSGSGTTGAVAVRWQRDFLGIDIRESQVALSRKRISQETPLMFT